MRATVPMASIVLKPWGVQVAGAFRRVFALRQWESMKKRLGAFGAVQSPVVSRVRSPRGRAGIYAVRIGADSRKAADAVCRTLHSAGGFCIVVRNR